MCTSEMIKKRWKEYKHILSTVSMIPRNYEFLMNSISHIVIYSSFQRIKSYPKNRSTNSLKI